MNFRNTMLSRVTAIGLLAGLCTSAAACLSVEKENLPPIAVVTATLNGSPVTDMKGVPIAVVAQDVKSSLKAGAGTAGTLTLDGSQSVDPEGEPFTFAWWNNGIPRQMRFPRDMPVAGAPGAPVDLSKIPAGPDGTGPTLTVQLSGAGKYVYSLYLTDSAGNISIPASVQVTIP